MICAFYFVVLPGQERELQTYTQYFAIGTQRGINLILNRKQRKKPVLIS